MTDRRNSFGYEDLLSCGLGELFGPGNAQLPLPPMLMFDRIDEIFEDGGNTLASADTHCHHAVACLSALEFVHQTNRKDRAAGPNWVTERNSASVDVHLVIGET